MPQRINDASEWRARVEEARALTDQQTDPEIRRILLGIALSYVQLTEMAEEPSRRSAERRRAQAT